MKANLCYCIVIALIIGSCAQKKSPAIEGSWQLVYAQAVYADTLNFAFPGNKSVGQIKMWSKDHFSFTGVLNYDSTASDTYGTGTYKLDSTRYTETLIYCAYKDFIGKTLKWNLEIKNDTLIQTSVGEDWKIDSSNYWLEKYVRL